MSIESEIFKKKHPDPARLKKFGFTKESGKLKYTEEIMNGDFKAVVMVDKKGNVEGHCLDVFSEEEYQPIRIAGNLGAYAASVKEAYMNVLEKIANECCLSLPFASVQANRIAMECLVRFGDRCDHSVFEKTPEIGVLRNPENLKWYAVIMPVEEKKIRGSGDHEVDVIDIKADPEDVQRFICKENYYPAWHMNKKNWFTIVLDESVDDEIIMDYLAVSRGFTLGRKAAHMSEGKCTAWLIPSNPLYYDIVGHMQYEDTTDWKQTSDVKPGDVVYMYVGRPYSSIMYKFTALQTDLTWTYDFNAKPHTRLMILKREESYDPRICTLTKMKKFGVNTVRGPRYMPKELIDYLDQNKGKDPSEF